MSIQTTAPAPAATPAEVPDAFTTLCDAAGLILQIGRPNVTDITAAAGHVKVILADDADTFDIADRLGLTGNRSTDWSDLDGEYRTYAWGRHPLGAVELDGPAHDGPRG